MTVVIAIQNDQVLECLKGYTIEFAMNITYTRLCNKYPDANIVVYDLDSEMILKKRR